jgi:hypothetical protein
MSTVRGNSADLMAPPVAETIQRRSFIIGILAAVIALIGLFMAPDQFFRSYLLGYMAWLGVSLGSMAILMLVHLTHGNWGMVIRRILEAATRNVLLMAVLFLPLLTGLPRLYPWARGAEAAKDEHLRHLSETFLSPSMFVIRAIVYFAIWIVLASLLTKWSAEQDTPNQKSDLRFRNLSAPGLVLYGLTVSFAAVDWVMSLDPHWISTIYGLLLLAGQILSAISFAVVVEVILSRYRPMSELLKPDHLHDHGKLMLTFVMVWAYFGFSQWLIIWAGNLPEEITWYLRRLHGGWQSIGLILALFHFGVPFILLLSRNFKRKPQTLVKLAVWLMVMRLLDLFWIIAPNFHENLHVTVWDIVVPVAMGGIWLGLFFRHLKARPLLSLYDAHASALLEPAHE